MPLNLVKYSCFIGLVLLFVSCVNKQERVLILETECPEDMMCEITNSGNYSAEFSMVINDLDLSTNYKIVNFIKNMPEQYPEEPLEMKVMRFVDEYTFHDDKLVDSKMMFNPEIVVNSVGGGLCNVRSSVLTNLLCLLGFKARSICLEGHVITEVYSNGNWRVMDADYGVCFLDTCGNIASREYLSTNPEIFNHLNNYIAIDADSTKLIKALLMNNFELYSTESDNYMYSTQFDKSIYSNEYTLPPSSSFSFPYGNTSNGKFYSFALLKINESWTGEIGNPFVVEKIVGKGEIVIGEKKFNLNGELTNFEDFEDFSGNVHILQNEGIILIHYYINPKIFAIENNNSLTLLGSSISELVVNLEDRPNPEKYYHTWFEEEIWQIVFDIITREIGVGNFGEMSEFEVVEILCENISSDNVSEIINKEMSDVDHLWLIPFNEYLNIKTIEFISNHCRENSSN